MGRRLETDVGRQGRGAVIPAEDGIWHDIEHKPYRDQQRAADAQFRTLVTA